MRRSRPPPPVHPWRRCEPLPSPSRLPRGTPPPPGNAGLLPGSPSGRGRTSAPRMASRIFPGSRAATSNRGTSSSAGEVGKGSIDRQPAPFGRRENVADSQQREQGIPAPDGDVHGRGVQGDPLAERHELGYSAGERRGRSPTRRGLPCSSRCRGRRGRGRGNHPGPASRRPRSPAAGRPRAGTSRDRRG